MRWNGHGEQQLCWTPMRGSDFEEVVVRWDAAIRWDEVMFMNNDCEKDLVLKWFCEVLMWERERERERERDR